MATEGVATDRRIMGGVERLPSTLPKMASESSEITPLSEATEVASGPVPTTAVDGAAPEWEFAAISIPGALLSGQSGGYSESKQVTGR